MLIIKTKFTIKIFDKKRTVETGKKGKTNCNSYLRNLVVSTLMLSQGSIVLIYFPPLKCLVDLSKVCAAADIILLVVYFLFSPFFDFSLFFLKGWISLSWSDFFPTPWGKVRLYSPVLSS